MGKYHRIDVDRGNQLRGGLLSALVLLWALASDARSGHKVCIRRSQ